MNKTVTATAAWMGNMRVEGQAQGHKLILDQPADMGGGDAGPNPMEVLLISLGGCQASVAAIIARQERIELRDFSVEMEGDYDMDFLMGKAQEGRSGFSEIRQKVFIDADLTLEEKTAFFEKVHARCPVTCSLLDETHITYEVE